VAKPNAVSEAQERPEGLSAFESRLLNILALHLVHGRQQADQIDLLSRAGFGPSEIAELLGTTSNTVNVRLSTQRALKNKNRQKKKKGKR
jgi:hypothetical protein